MEKHDNDECHKSFILKQKSGLGALDMVAVGQRASGCLTAPTIRYEKIRSQSPYFSKGLGSVG